MGKRSKLKAGRREGTATMKRFFRDCPGPYSSPEAFDRAYNAWLDRQPKVFRVKNLPGDLPLGFSRG